jgi:hypothetical protein
MRARLAAVVLVALAAASCGGHHGAPNVKGMPFPAALARLRADGWRVSVPSFPPIDGSLESYRVVAQRTSGRRTVILRVAAARTHVLVLVGVGTEPPIVPRFVGQTYRNAYRSALQNAMALHVTHVKPLRPAASADGIDAFFVVSLRSEDVHTLAVRLGERPCWKSVIEDWILDGSLDGVYLRHCYREALRRLPDDMRGNLPQLLERRLR